MDQKMAPLWVPDSGPKIGAVFRTLIVIITERWAAVPILGPESGTQTGPLFRPSGPEIRNPGSLKPATLVHEKCTPFSPWYGRPFRHTNAQIRAICSTTTSPQHSLAPPSFNKMCTAEPFLALHNPPPTGPLLSSRLPLAMMQHNHALVADTETICNGTFAAKSGAI